ncbi:MHYT domain-containing protein [Dendronalium sp. ChiSLP03b]|uniref:MHYT domain-containing protein n=1 Tax=Dendronalium sp. ChiSLP03b TaxID=3075381 RepID=UPI002AD1EDDC|nr:MHYT domain-containing protein [Dendronalium sp. ChiSLP03b]MDZ8207236.1 MHYT domain-containing protein [Dendronalium sp. ChiSLP03b]
MNSTHDLRLVALSIAIAVLASYTALDLAVRVTAAKASARLAWLIGGAIVMGIGIWSMHFVAMLAFSLPMPMSYDMLTVLVSMLPAVVASGGALFLASRPILSIWQLLIGGTLMGIGIASMHYIGMLAMRMEAITRYDPLLFVLSLAIAIGASIVALWIAFQLRMQTGKNAWWIRIGSALVMGSAIAGMHYTGMAAARFTPTNPKAISATGGTNYSLTWLAVSIGISTLVILGFALLTSLVEQHLIAQTKLLEQQEAEARRSQLFTEITLQIRRSLNLDDVMNTTVHEVRQALKADRVIIYRFDPDWSGDIIAESVSTGWMKTLGKTVNDPFRENYIEMYKNGRVRATNNIYKAGFTDCHREILEGFQIKASLVAPIINNSQLVSLLCVHQCSQPRNWQKYEIDLFRQLAIQVGIALEQASLLHELEQAQKVLRLRDRAIAAASNAIFITDPRHPENPIVFCNAAFEKITGYSPEEALGRNYKFLQGIDTDLATVKQLNHAIQNASEYQVVLKSYRKDGSSFWCELSISPVRDAFGKVINFIGVLAEITSRKQGEEELKRSKEDLQSQLLELLTDVEQASQGDLTVRSQITNGEIGILADVVNTIIESLQQIVIQVKKAAHQVNVSVGDKSDVIQQLAKDALQQAEEITYTLQEVDKMNLWIQSVADTARQAEVVAGTASNKAEIAQVAIDYTVESIWNLQQTVTEIANKVKHLSESAQTISLVALSIKQIALQTNLLAADAGIETAWMGHEGRGFALLVEQIGQLAVQSAEATEEIQHILKSIELETSEVVKTIELGKTEVVERANLVQNTKLSLEHIIDASHQINHLVQSISIATGSQAETSQAIASLIKQIAKVSKHSVNSSSIMSGSLQQAVEFALQLQASVDAFKTEE